MESSKIAAGVLLGVGVGALLGILFAPEKGSRTRQRIMDKSQDYIDDLKGKIDEVFHNASEQYDDFLDQAKSMATTK